MSAKQHTDIAPAILYFGSAVTLLGSTNEDGSYNLAPMSSIWWLGYGCMLGLDASSKTTENVLRTKQLTINLPSDGLQHAVNALARTTGTNPVPQSKVDRGYIYVKDKFAAAGLTELKSEHVDTPGVQECPVVMEAELVHTHPLYEGKAYQGAVLALEMRIVKVSVHAGIRLQGYKNRIDTDKWKPIVMMFSEMYGVREGRLSRSYLADINEEMYRGLTGTKVDDDDDEMIETSPAGRVTSRNQ